MKWNSSAFLLCLLFLFLLLCYSIVFLGETGLTVHNADTDSSCAFIQEAMSAPKTLDETERVAGTTDTKYNWSMFRHDLEHTGYTTASPLYYSPIIKVKWVFQATPDYISSSPIIADVNTDGESEIVIGSDNCNVYCLNVNDGSVLWCFSMGGSVSGSPATADINDDGRLEVVVGSLDGKIYSLRGEDGSLLWIRKTDHQIASSPAIADINGDGELEVVIGSNDNKIYALHGKTGSVLWSYTTLGSVSSSPAVADINGDGELEVVVGSHDYNVYALKGEDGSLLWRTRGSGVIVSSPAIADLDNDGELEVVVGSGHGRIYVLRGVNGQILRSYETEGAVYSSPAIADVNNDGELDIVVGSHDKKVYAIRGADCSKLWDFATRDYVQSSPSIADVTGDGNLEVVVGSWDGNTYFLRGRDGSLLWSYFTHDIVQGNPAIANIDDEKLIIVVGAHYSNVYAFETVWTVDDDRPAHFDTIQEAINSANNGDTIFVRNGSYYENVIVNKTVSLIGENRETTIIDGNYNGTVVHVTADEVIVRNFTVQESGSKPLTSGIRLESDHCTITNNLVVKNYRGICVYFSEYNNVFSNNIMNNEYGVSI